MAINSEVVIIHPDRTPKAGGTLIKHCRIRGKTRMRSEISKRSFERLELPGQSKINCMSRIVDAMLEQQKKQQQQLERPISTLALRTLLLRCKIKVLHERVNRLVSIARADGPILEESTVTLGYARRPNGPAQIRRTKVLAKGRPMAVVHVRTAPPVSEVWMPARHVEVRDEERDRHKTRRFTVAESVVKQTHFPLMVPSQATAAPQKHRACRA